MTDLLLCEEVFLLGHDDQSGKNTVSQGLTGAVAGALLLDLALAEVIGIEGKDTVVLTGANPAHPLLQQAAAVIAGEQKERSARSCLALLPRRIEHLPEQVGRSLVDLGILSEERAKVLGLFPTTRWPERDHGPESGLRARLAEVLLDRAEPTPHDLALIALLKSYNLVDGLVDKDDRKQARQTAETLRKQAESGDVVSQAIGSAVRATQAAVMAAIIAANTAATTATIASN